MERVRAKPGMEKVGQKPMGHFASGGNFADGGRDLQETDSQGGVRSQKSSQSSHAAVYQEESGTKTPFVGKEKAPKIAGVLIVAQGGGETAVKQNISDAVMALFQIDVNRIKVVKMNIQEEEK